MMVVSHMEAFIGRKQEATYVNRASLSIHDVLPTTTLVCYVQKATSQFFLNLDLIMTIFSLCDHIKMEARTCRQAGNKHKIINHKMVHQRITKQLMLG